MQFKALSQGNKVQSTISSPPVQFNIEALKIMDQIMFNHTRVLQKLLNIKKINWNKRFKNKKILREKKKRKYYRLKILTMMKKRN